VLVALIFQDLQYTQRSIQDRIGVLYFITINQSFGPLVGVVDVFPAEKKIVRNEVISQSYAISAYFLSRVIAEVVSLVPINIAYCAIVYWSVHLNPDPGRFLIFTGLILLETMVAMSLGFAISAVAPSLSVASALASPVLIVMILFGGYYINVASLPPGSEWLIYVSFIKWTFQVSYSFKTSNM
jgi:ATP-binding cassette subfamily G (WHITE) protein 2